MCAHFMRHACLRGQAAPPSFDTGVRVPADAALWSIGGSCRKQAPPVWKPVYLASTHLPGGPVQAPRLHVRPGSGPELAIPRMGLVKVIHSRQIIACCIFPAVLLLKRHLLHKGMAPATPASLQAVPAACSSGSKVTGPATCWSCRRAEPRPGTLPKAGAGRGGTRGRAGAAAAGDRGGCRRRGQRERQQRRRSAAGQALALMPCVVACWAGLHSSFKRSAALLTSKQQWCRDLHCSTSELLPWCPLLIMVTLCERQV